MTSQCGITIHKFEILQPKPNEKIGITAPHPRSGHRIVADEANIYSIGGYNPDFWGVANNAHTYYPLFKELWRFNFATKKWSQQHTTMTTGSMPVELASHSALLYGQNLVVFGGTGVPFGESATNNLSMYNLERDVWRQAECTGSLPTCVYGQSMHIDNDDIYIFGGTTGWEYNSELHKLDMLTGAWTMVETTGEIPEGRYRHEVACYDRKMFVFGGGRSYLCYDLKKIPVLDMKTYHWSIAPTVSDRSHGFPAERRCHSCVQFNKAAYICGGYNGEHIFDDVWRLCLDSLKWTKLKATMPEPSYFHSAAVTPAGCMMVYGGVTEIDTIRTSNIYRIWLEAPTSLRELAWIKITECITDMDQIPVSRLLELGIPQHFVSRIYPQCPQGSTEDIDVRPSVCG